MPPSDPTSANPYSAPSAGSAPRVDPTFTPPVEYRPGGRVATTSYVLLLANAGISLLAAIFWIVMWSRLSRMNVSLGWWQSVAVQTLLLTIANAVLIILTAVFFSIWYYRAYSNLLALGNATTHHGLWWAPAGFYIPLLNLFMPYLIGREIWLKSDPVNLRRGPRDFQLMPRSRSTALVAGWWLCLVSAQVLGQIAQSGVERLRLDRLGSIFFLLIIAALLSAAAAIQGALLIRGVERRQQARHARLSAPPEGPDSGRSQALF